MKDSTSRAAVIGIGSNSVRLLVAEGLEVLERGEVVTRLAHYDSSVAGEMRLTDVAVRATTDAARGFLRRVAEMGADLKAVLATEAVRAAANRVELTGRLERELGMPVSIITGEEEAALGWRAVAGTYRTAASLAVIDIGGGSTDISAGLPRSPIPETVQSLKLGSRTITIRFGLDLPVAPRGIETILRTLGQEIRLVAASGLRPGVAVVIGGTADVLASVSSYASGELSGTQDTLIEKAWLEGWLHEMAGLDLQERAAVGVPADRADIIVGGGAILLALLVEWGLGEFYTTRRNILDGYLAQ